MGHTGKQLEALSEMLLDLPYENDGMLLSEFDGFVAGILVCPEMIMPGEWLPLVWGEDHTPNFDTMDEAQRKMDAVMAHYNRVAQDLARPEPEYEAVYEIDPNTDETLWEPWISGFEQAMQLRVDCWEATLDSTDEEVRSTIPMILALHEINIGTSELDEAAIDELDEIAPDLIPGMVLSLNAWTKGQTGMPGPANLAMAPSGILPGRTKVGRNEPCPCGSGKKFKKCCGSVTFH